MAAADKVGEQLASKKVRFPSGNGHLWRLCTRRSHAYHDSVSHEVDGACLLHRSLFSWLRWRSLGICTSQESNDVIGAAAEYFVGTSMPGGRQASKHADKDERHRSSDGDCSQLERN
jgi:hypothetical protein